MHMNLVIWPQATVLQLSGMSKLYSCQGNSDLLPHYNKLMLRKSTNKPKEPFHNLLSLLLFCLYISTHKMFSLLVSLHKLFVVTFEAMHYYKSRL